MWNLDLTRTQIHHYKCFRLGVRKPKTYGTNRLIDLMYDALDAHEARMDKPMRWVPLPKRPTADIASVAIIAIYHYIRRSRYKSSLKRPLYAPIRHGMKVNSLKLRRISWKSCRAGRQLKTVFKIAERVILNRSTRRTK